MVWKMCYNLMKIRSKSPQGVKFSFIPCGYCAQCREATRLQWSVRLALEMQESVKRGWKVAFFTLTYDNDHLPTVPDCYFPADNIPLDPVPCFARSHVRNFVDSVRKWLHRNYGIVGCPYLVATDFGLHTFRPHYHGLISYPVGVRKKNTRYADKSAPEVFDSFVLHSKIKELWTYGFVFPRHPLGGRDSHGYDHKSFELTGDAVTASFYAAKYCAKSVAFYQLCKDVLVDTKMDGWKEFDSFHIQSKSLGLSYLKSLDYEKQSQLLRHGVSFIGKDKTYSVPIYFKNKLLFNPVYSYRPDGTRVVGREATGFFERNYESIFDEKVKFYTRVANDSCTGDFLRAQGVPVDDAALRPLLQYRDKSGMDNKQLAELYLGYFGIKLTSIYKGLSSCDQWFTRYFPHRFACLGVDYDFSRSANFQAGIAFWSYLLDTISTNNGVDEFAVWEQELVKDFHKTQNEVYLCSENDSLSA